MLLRNTENLFKKIIMVTEFIYLNEDGTIMYTSRNHPLKYEDQTDCIKIQVETDHTPRN